MKELTLLKHAIKEKQKQHDKIMKPLIKEKEKLEDEEFKTEFEKNKNRYYKYKETNIRSGDVFKIIKNLENFRYIVTRISYYIDKSFYNSNIAIIQDNFSPHFFKDYCEEITKEEFEKQKQKVLKYLKVK